MKLLLLSAGLLLAGSVAAAQTKTPAQDPGFVNLTTPMVLAKGTSLASIGFNYAGDPGNQFFTSLGYGYGIGDGWQFDLRGTFSSFKRYSLADGSDIRFGGSAGEALVKYLVPNLGFDGSVEGGIIYAATPAQQHRGEGVVGVSAGYAIDKIVRLYVNPKIITSQGEPLIGIGVGAIVDITDGIQGFGEWTPLVDGRNYVSTSSGSLERVQLYGIGVRFTRIAPNLSLDIAYTNSSGETSGFGLTPSLGNVGGVQVGLTYRF